jgi:hypothetical protein
MFESAIAEYLLFHAVERTATAFEDRPKIEYLSDSGTELHRKRRRKIILQGVTHGFELL